MESLFGSESVSDQQAAGLIMWVPSEVMTIIAMAIVFFFWVRRSERAQRKADARRFGSPAL